MATFTLEIKDNIQTGEVDMEGRLEGNDPDALPTGAGILHAYFSNNIDAISQEAQTWFRAKLVEAASKCAPEVQQ